MRHRAPFFIRSGPYTFGNHVLWPLAVVLWALPVLWRVGNWIQSMRFRLYQRYGWEWI